MLATTSAQVCVPLGHSSLYLLLVLFKVTVYLQVEYQKTVRFKDKVTKEH